MILLGTDGDGDGSYGNGDVGKKTNGLTPRFYGFIRDNHVSIDQPPFMNHINYDDSNL